MIRLPALIVGIVLLAAHAQAQTSSLFVRDLPLHEGPGLSLHEASLTLHRLPPPRQIRVRDLITVRVDQKSVVIAEGRINRRKNMLYDAVLKDWIVLNGLSSIKPSPQSDGDPRANGQFNQQNRSQADLQTRESLTTEIMAEVVDIRPNGTIVLEAHSFVENNNEVWELSLSGVCRPEDIEPNNVVLSRNLAELRVSKHECGHIRDSYRRGWLSRWLDKYGPF